MCYISVLQTSKVRLWDQLLWVTLRIKFKTDSEKSEVDCETMRRGPKLHMCLMVKL